MSATSFLSVCWPLSPLTGGVTDAVSRACAGYLIRASTLLCGCTGLSGRGLLPRCWSRGPQIPSLTVCVICGMRQRGWRTPPQRETTGYSHSGAVHRGCALLSPFARVRALRWRHWHISQPHRKCGNATVGPGVSPVLFSPGHQHPSTEVRAQVAVIMDLDCLGVLWSSSDSALAPPQCVRVPKVLSCKS